MYSIMQLRKNNKCTCLWPRDSKTAAFSLAVGKTIFFKLILYKMPVHHPSSIHLYVLYTIIQIINRMQRKQTDYNDKLNIWIFEYNKQYTTFSQQISNFMFVGIWKYVSPIFWCKSHNRKTNKKCWLHY